VPTVNGQTTMGVEGTGRHGVEGPRWGATYQLSEVQGRELSPLAMQLNTPQTQEEQGSQWKEGNKEGHMQSKGMMFKETKEIPWGRARLFHNLFTGHKKKKGEKKRC